MRLLAHSRCSWVELNEHLISEGQLEVKLEPCFRAVKKISEITCSLKKNNFVLVLIALLINFQGRTQAWRIRIPGTSHPRASPRGSSQGHLLSQPSLPASGISFPSWTARPPFLSACLSLSAVRNLHHLLETFQTPESIYSSLILF